MQIEQNSILQQNIQNLYSAFSRYKIGTTVEGSINISKADIDGLCGSKLRDLSYPHLSTYSFKAMTSWGTEQDFKHFLPRLIELVTPRFFLNDPADSEFAPTFIIFEKIQHTRFHAWPKGEKSAIIQYFDDLWEIILDLGPEKSSALEFFEATGSTGLSLETYLNRMANRENVEAIWHISRLITGDYPDLPKRSEETYARFLYSQQMTTKLETAFFKYSDHACAPDLSEAEDKLHWQLVAIDEA